MIKITGYQVLERIYESSRTLVYRGYRESDRLPVAIKIGRNEYPSISQVIEFRNQYTLVKNLNIPGIIKPYSLEPYHHSYALILEDFGGLSLAEYILPNSLHLTEFWTISLQIVEILAELHNQRIIHKDIKPSNILINPETKEIKITDFSIASLLPKENQNCTSPQELEGTLAYMSPEQTGRMNRGLDYRTDFYSLGVTFYEMLTGCLPFEVNDPIELIHCHLAQQPPSILAIKPNIPAIVGALVDKLMAKNAEERYQSALGLKVDLERMQEQWLNTENISPFSLGERDNNDRFLIPEKLYGREEEVKTLLAAFDRITNHPSNNSQRKGAEIMLVAGFSGIGKTAVINEIHKPIVKQRGYFIKGKFDQFQRNIPFSALVQALRDLISQLLTELPQRIAAWKKKILAAVGPNGQVIMEVVPELETLIGPQPPVPDVEAMASQNRFNFVFEKFLQVFSSAEHPLVIFLDDLQWVDAASLQLIKLLVSSQENKYLLLILAYRDNEIYPSHPFSLALNEIRNKGASLSTLTLAPLTENNLNLLVADTLKCPESVALPLTELIYDKTLGNPFFSIQFLKALYDDKLIQFNAQQKYWECDLPEVKTLSLSDDVVEFMSLQLQKLHPRTQKALKLAACIGNSFDLNTLAIISEKSLADTAANLWTALKEELILPISENYKFFQQDREIIAAQADLELFIPYRFLHDRIQQAAYALIPEREKQATHFHIGRLLLQNTPEAERDEKIFEIVNQLNYGIGLIDEPGKRENLARLNLLAGVKAKTATAYQAARGYFTVARELLAENCWETQYNLTLEIYEFAAQTAYLEGNLEEMEVLVNEVLANTKNILDRVKVYEIQIQAYVGQNQQLKAVGIALHALQFFGIYFPQEPSLDDLSLALTETRAKIGDRNLEELAQMSLMTDPEAIASLRLLVITTAAAFVSTPKLMILIALKQVNLALEYGLSELAAYAYSLYGLILCGVTLELELGCKFGDLALKVLELTNAQQMKVKTFTVVHIQILHWRQKLSQNLKPLAYAAQLGMDNGDLEYAGYAANQHCLQSFFQGLPLGDVADKFSQSIAQFKNFKQIAIVGYLELIQSIVIALHGELKIDDIFNTYLKEDQISVYQSLNNKYGLFTVFFTRLVIAYSFGDYHQAVIWGEEGEKYLEGVTSLIFIPVFYYYYALGILVVYEGTSPELQSRLWQKVKIAREKMKLFSDAAPVNYLHKLYLIEAEMHRVLGQKSEAIELYDLAIATAQANEYPQEQALANELAAKFYLQWGKNAIAQTYMTDAYYGYARWGAKAKLAQLEQLYPELIAPILEQQSTIFSWEETLNIPPILTTKNVSITSTTSSNVLDLTTLLKATQTLAREVELESLVKQLLKIVMENAGADKICLLFPQQNSWQLRARATIDGITEVILETGIEPHLEVSMTAIEYARQTQDILLVEDATQDNRFLNDVYIQEAQPKSLLVIPLLDQRKIVGILYLENKLVGRVFASDRLEILKILSSQAAISLTNAFLYRESQNYSQELNNSLAQLEQTKLQMIQSEKVAVIGALVAGFSHEINNPLGLIIGNTNHTIDHLQELTNHLNLYQEHYPDPVAAIAENAKEIEVDFLVADLPRLLLSIKQDTTRIQAITKALQTFAGVDGSHKVLFNINDGLDSALMILQHRLKANEERPAIEVIKNYGEIPDILCYPGSINQVFMNILVNGIDALEKSNNGKFYSQIEAAPNRLMIRSEWHHDRQSVMVTIADNGIGISPEAKAQIFDASFTSKPQGTGLGLAIAKQIVEEQHGGTIEVTSNPGLRTELIITLPRGN